MTQQQVREWWNRNPMSYDVDDPIPFEEGSREYFREIDRRIRELESLRASLDDLSRYIEHCECEPGQAVLDCNYCPILDEEGGDLNGP